MKDKSNSVLASIGRGIKQAARWVAKMFGYKAENLFGKIVWRVFSVSATLVLLFLAVIGIILTVEWVNETRNDIRYDRQQKDPTYLHDFCNQYVSPYIIYHDGYPYYLYDIRLGQRTLTSVKWICKSSDGDSLTVFSDGKKRGYFNRFTGKEVIPPKYEKAWIFSEGMACVLDKGTLHFIDRKGQTAIDKIYPYTKLIDDYCFHNGLCSVLGDNNRIGLIDKQGNWVVDPEYYQMSYDTKGFWLVQDREWNYGLLDKEGKVLLPIEYNSITINHDDSTIYTHRLDHIQQVLDFECNVVNSCNYAFVTKLFYDTDEYNEYGDPKSAPAYCLQYYTDDDYYGLMDSKGNIITPPYYSDINAIAPDRYHCIGPKGSVILDDKGKECGEKL